MPGIHQQGHQMRGTAARAGSPWAQITHQENSGILETHTALEEAPVPIPPGSDRRFCGPCPSALHQALNWLTFDWISRLPLHYSALFDKFIKHQKSCLCSFSKGIIRISLHN